jgi:hypothetical protein
MLSQLNLNLYNFIRNHNNVSLDLLLLNVHVNVPNDPDLLLPIDKHHPALNISLDCNKFDLLQVSDLVYDFKNCNYINFIYFLGNLISIQIFNSSDINILINQLYPILYNAVDNFIPLNYIFYRFFFTWYSKKLKLLIKEKNCSFSLNTK